MYITTPWLLVCILLALGAFLQGTWVYADAKLDSREGVPWGLLLISALVWPLVAVGALAIFLVVKIWEPNEKGEPPR